MNDHITVSIQPDFSSEVGGKENTLVLRQDYADIYLDDARTVRTRIGQGEVPTNFEALQSSSRRAPFDRSDAMESTTPGEQELGIFLYWTPVAVKRRFHELASARLKGTADYGAVGLGSTTARVEIAPRERFTAHRRAGRLPVPRPRTVR